MIWPVPFKLCAILSITTAILKDRADLVAENGALRHQLSCLIHRGWRPKLRPVDRVFWVLLSRFRNGWRKSLAMVKLATVLAWHRNIGNQRFALHAQSSFARRFPAAMGYVLSQSFARDARERFRCRSHSDVRRSLRVLCPQLRSTTGPSFPWDSASDSGVDRLTGS
jgi:hypothetical protein